MTEIIPTSKKPTGVGGALAYLEDTTGGIDVAGIDVDDDNYDNGTFRDRDYDVRLLNKISILLENLGPNDVKYTILSTTQDFDDLDADLVTADFTEVEKAEATITAGAQATGSVEVTGGPSVKADGTLTLVSAVALTKATGTITIATPVANTFATGTAALTSVVVTDTVTINGLIYLAVSGTASEGEFDIDGNDDANAIELRNAINADTRSGTSGDLTATASTNVVTATTDVAGTAGNAITFTSQDATIVVSGSGTLTGGITADTVTANGLVYTAVAGAKANDTEFSIDSTDTATAVDLADSIDDDVRSGTLNDLTAINASAVVTCTQTVGGTGGNATTLVSSDGTRLAVSGAVFTGGLEPDTVTVNGLLYTAITGSKGGDDTKFSIDTSDTAAATDLADSIDDDIRTPITVPTIDVSATSSIGVVTVSAPVNDGAAGNAIDISGTSNITADNATLTSGVSSTMDGIDIAGVEIMSGAVPWRTSDTLTGDDIETNINAFTSTPNYTAANVAGVVTITRVGSTPDTGTVTSSTTVMTKTDVNMTGGAKGVSDVTNIERATPQITALKVRAKEASGGSPGKIRADIKFRP